MDLKLFPASPRDDRTMFQSLEANRKPAVIRKQAVSLKQNKVVLKRPSVQAKEMQVGEIMSVLLRSYMVRL